MGLNSTEDHNYLEPLDAGEGPAPPQSPSAESRSVRVILARVSGRGGRVRFGWRLRMPLAAAVAAIAIPGVCAAFFVAGPVFFAGTSNPDEHEAAKLPGVNAAHSHQRSVAVPREVDLATESAAKVDEPKLVEVVEVSEPTGPTERQKNQGAATPLAPAKKPTPGGSRPNADDSMGAANALRAERRWASAAKAYSQIANLHANTAQGSVAALAAGALYLEHLSAPRRALELYKRSLQNSGLSAEATMGIANCYRALGDRSSEITTLKKLLSANPSALLTERVKRRLAALESPKP